MSGHYLTGAALCAVFALVMFGLAWQDRRAGAGAVIYYVVLGLLLLLAAGLLAWAALAVWGY